jgi:hypothetical protein
MANAMGVPDHNNDLVCADGVAASRFSICNIDDDLKKIWHEYNYCQS